MRANGHSGLLTCLICIFIAIMFMPIVGATGVGMGPSEFQITDALRGTTVERTVTVYNLGDTATPVTMSADGTAGSWVSFYSPDTSSAPVNVITVKPRTNILVVIRMTIPADTANGNYNTTIRAKITPPELKGIELGVTASMEAVSTISLDVSGKQTMSGTVDYITADDSEPNFPVTIRVLFHNTGNVAVNPLVTAMISGKTGTLDTVTYKATKVNAGQGEILVLRWNKTNIDPGNYSAMVKVSLDNTQIATSTVPFMIFSSGTLSRQGILSDLSYTGTPSTDSLLKITGTFENTGTIETKAKLIGEIYRNTALVDTFTSDELSIPINDKGELTYYLKITTPGQYTIKSYVLYEGKKTDQKEISFNTNGGTTTTGSSKTPLSPVLPVFAFMSVGLLLYLRKTFFR